MQSENTQQVRKNVLIILAFGFLTGAAVDRFALGDFFAGTSSINTRLISEAWNKIRTVYVDRGAVNPQVITYGAIDGMVDALGDTGHSRFLNPQMVKRLKQLEKNNFEGIGAEVRIKDNHLVVVAPIEGSPAQRAGLKPGDIILKVNGTNVTGMKLDESIERIQGPAGTQVTLTIMSSGSGRTSDITLTRSRITIHEVTWDQLPGIPLAHIHIANFSRGAGDDLIQALRSAKKNEVRGAILDLRNNPGGLLREAVAAASQFLAGGNVLLEKSADGKTRSIAVEPGGVATEMPLVVLVNKGSASGSEIVAGALQDSKRAQIVGEATFGTGTVLSEFRLSDGSALLLAVQEWLTPKGHLIWHKGIMPDVSVSLPADAVPLFPGSGRNLQNLHWSELPDKQLVEAIAVLSK